MVSSKDYQGLQQRLIISLRKRQRRPHWILFGDHIQEAIVEQKKKRRQGGTFDATKKFQSQQLRIVISLCKRKRTTVQNIIVFMAEYASDGTNDTLKAAVDLQDQLIMAGRNNAGFKDHMIEN